MEMTSYEPGTPSWVDIGVPDMDAAVAFYGGLFGWEFDEGDPEAGGYRQARLRGQSVAGFGPQMNPGPPMWTTYVATADADATEAAVVAAGGQVIVPVMDVMDVGRMGVYTDSTGTFFSTWQALAHPGAGIVNEPGSLTWNELTTRDVAPAEAFYGEVFGWTSHHTGDQPSDYIEWHLGERTIGGLMPMVGDMWPADLPNHWMVYFGVSDTDAAAARVVELGGSVPVPPFDTPAGRIAVVNDTAGAHFSIITLAPGMAG